MQQEVFEVTCKDCRFFIAEKRLPDGSYFCAAPTKFSPWTCKKWPVCVFFKPLQMKLF